MSSLSLLARTCLVIIVSWTSFLYVNALSSPKRPLKRVEQPIVQAIEIIPRTHLLRSRSQLSPSPSVSPYSTTLYNTDTFRITLSAFEQNFHLHLRPNLELFHPAARINYYKNGPNGQAVLDRAEPLLSSNVRVYGGDVLHPEDSHDRIREDVVGGLLRSSKPTLGWARIMVHHQGDATTGKSPVFEGAFSVDGVIHHVTTLAAYMRLKHPLDPVIESEEEASELVIFRDSDIMDEREEAIFKRSLFGEDEADEFPVSISETCAHDHLAWNTDASLNPTLRKQEDSAWFDSFEKYVTPFGFNTSLTRRDDVAGSTSSTNFAGTIGQTAGCPLEQKIVFMGVAADCKYVQQYGSSSNATTAILNDWNIASGLYKQTFNVSLGIVELDMHETTCPSPQDPTRPWNVDCSSVTLDQRLAFFSTWRGQKGEDGAGLWHLMSGCPTGTEVGVAWLGTLCQTKVTGESNGQQVSGTAVTTAGKAEWQVVAHEIGHNFGAIHDCSSGCNSSSPCCPLSTGACDSSGSFIMSPTASTAEMRFSQCSLGNICSVMQSRKSDFTCMQSPDSNIKTLALQMCGNGIVEVGEDCDPGPGVNSTCCNSATCKFTAGAVCDPDSTPCCTGQCQFAPSTQVCRPSQDPTCDIAELCTGTSANCPWDRNKPDGLSCGNGLACASGVCTSPSKQCQTVGASLNLSKACDTKGDTSCQVSCQDPSNSGRCLVLQAQLINGSPCGYAGKCSGGKCQPGSLFDMLKAWYVSNLQISIPVTVVAGVVLLFILYALIRCMARCCCGAGRRDSSMEPSMKGIRPKRISSWMGPPLPPAAAQPAPVTRQPSERVWVPPTGRGGSRDPSIRSNSSGPRPSLSGTRPSISDSRPPANMYIPGALRPGGASSTRGQPSGPSERAPRNWVDPSLYNGPIR